MKRKQVSITPEVGRRLDEARGKLSVSEFLDKLLPLSPSRQLKITHSQLRALFLTLLQSTEEKERELSLKAIFDSFEQTIGFWIVDKQLQEAILRPLTELVEKMRQEMIKYDQEED